MVDARHPTGRTVMVLGPRAGDAVGTALRDAYRRPASLPAEFDALITRLDQVRTR